MKRAANAGHEAIAAVSRMGRPHVLLKCVQRHIAPDVDERIKDCVDTLGLLWRHVPHLPLLHRLAGVGPRFSKTAASASAHTSSKLTLTW